MTPDRAAKLARMTVVARSLREASRAAWEKGHLREAAGLYARADAAESRARDFELAGIGEELGKKVVVLSFTGGAHLI